MPELKRGGFFFLIEMQIVNFMQTRSGMSHKQFAHNFLNRKSGKACSTRPVDAVNDKLSEKDIMMPIT